MEEWDAVIMGNDELLEKYMSGKPFKMSELEQEEKTGDSKTERYFPFITGRR